MDPWNVALTETEIGVLLPIGNGPASVICSVKVVVCDAKSIEVLLFTPEKAKVPRVGLPLVVMLVELCGVYVTETPPPKDKVDADVLRELLLKPPAVEKITSLELSGSLMPVIAYAIPSVVE